MRRLFAAAVAIALPTSIAFAQNRSDLVEFEMMTWPEVKAAMAAGKTTALFYTGGTEQRGPQNVNGGHTLMGREIVKRIAIRLGNAIAMPTIPYTPNNASATLPGTIGLTPELLGMLLERMSEQAIATGFKNVVLMGDHGGGQPGTYKEVAEKLDAKYGPQGIHVYYCDDVYIKAGADFDKWLEENGYPASSHAGIPDTSEMLYLGGDTWVRKDQLPNAVGTPVVRRPPGDSAGRGRGRGAAGDSTAGRAGGGRRGGGGGGRAGGDSTRVNNGISGDARRSTAELGKRAIDMKVDYAVKQIQGFIKK